MVRGCRLAAGVLLWCAVLAVTPAHAATPNENANRTFVEAMQLLRRANNTLDTRESVRLLHGVDNLLKKVVQDYPESGLAVQIATNQFIGDFDVMEFKSRIRSLSCERGSYVEDFLSEYGVVTATGPLTEACFLYRTETLLAPPEDPLTSARPDWLSLAVAYYLYGQQERAREIILPFLSLLRKSSPGADTQESFLFLARTLAITGAFDSALKMGERINDCTNRLNHMMEMMKVTLHQGDMRAAKIQADQLRDYADANQCNWQKGLVAQALYMTERKGDAKIRYEKAAADQYAGTRPEERSETTPPDLVIAASLMEDPATALAMLRVVIDRNPWVATPVLVNLAGRGNFTGAQDFALYEIKEPERMAEALAALVEVLVQKNELKRAQALMARLNDIHISPSQPYQQSLVFAVRAWAEKALYRDERWRETYQAALNAAERVEENNRMQLVPPLLAMLTQIKTNKPVLAQ